MRFADFPFLRYLPFLLLGIGWANSGYVPSMTLLWSVVLGIWAGYVAIVLKCPQGRTGILSVLAYLLLFFFGAVLVGYRGHHPESVYPVHKADGYLGKVTAYDVVKQNSFENILEIITVSDQGEWKDASGQVLVYHQRKQPLIPGELVWVDQAPDVIKPPKNPSEFNYRDFLRRKGIYFSQFLGGEAKVLSSDQQVDFSAILPHVRYHIAEMLRSRIPDEDSQQIALALLLGQKQTLDPDLREAYVQSGVMHILAVSGLHVGIVYALLLFLIKPLGFTKKNSRLFLSGIMAVIWLYAFLTGLSPSVVRATTMFSLLILGQMRDRKPSIFNVLAFSAMLMIVFNPDVLGEVGFQLSYLAVFGIVLLYPLILSWWTPSNRIMEYFWQLTAVSLAAQLATFPLSVYYFHVFPSYFLLSNLLIVPLSFLVMQVGVPLMLVGWFDVVGDSLGWVLSGLIWCQNMITYMIQLIPGGKWDRLTISFLEMVIVWGVLLLWTFWEAAVRRKIAWLLIFLFFIWSSERLVSGLKSPEKQLLVYEKEDGAVLDFAVNGKLFSWNEGMKPSDIGFAVDPNRIVNGWPQVPYPIKGMELGGMVVFPGLPFELQNSGHKRLVLSKVGSERIQYWEIDRWGVPMEVNDTLELGGNAFRILF